MILLLSGFQPSVQAKCKQAPIFQNGSVHLQNGFKATGWVSLKKSHGEDIVLFKQSNNSLKTYQYPVSEISAFQIGEQQYLVRNVQALNGKDALAVLKPVIPDNTTIYTATYYQEVALGKNNSKLQRIETPYLLHRGDYIALSGADYKKKLADLWADEQAYLEKLNSYDKIGMEELQQILTD